MNQNQLIELIAEVLEMSPSDLNLDSRLGEVEEWDSLRHLQIFMRLEEVSGIPVDMEKVPDLDSIGKILVYLAQAG